MVSGALPGYHRRHPATHRALPEISFRQRRYFEGRWPFVINVDEDYLEQNPDLATLAVARPATLVRRQTDRPIRQFRPLIGTTAVITHHSERRDDNNLPL